MQQPPSSLLIAAIRRRLKQFVGTRVRDYRLSPAQFWVLNRIFERQGLSLRELAEALYMDAPTASRVVARLVAMKLVRVEDDPADRRRGRLVPTTRGRALGAELHEVAIEVRGAVEAGLTPAERESLRMLLEKVLAHVGQL